MIFEKKKKHCDECRFTDMCKWKEHYYKNKGGWPKNEVCDEYGVCKEAKRQGLVR